MKSGRNGCPCAPPTPQPPPPHAPLPPFAIRKPLVAVLQCCGHRKQQQPRVGRIGGFAVSPPPKKPTLRDPPPTRAHLLGIPGLQ